MAIRWRKSIKMGPARINLSNRGVGWSVGTKGFRVGHYASGKKKSHTKRTATRKSSADVSISDLPALKTAINVVRLLFLWLASFTVYREFPHSASWAALLAIILVLPIAPLRGMLAYVYPTVARWVMVFWFGWMTFYTTKDTGVLIFAWGFAVVWTAIWAFVCYKIRTASAVADELDEASASADVPKLDT